MSFDSPVPSASDVCPPGSKYPLLPGVRSRFAQTARGRFHVYEGGTPGDEPVVLIHGNASSARFFEDAVAAMPGYAVFAPDLRGYGASDAAVVDARRGMRDFADDIHALVESLGIARFHLLGWSLGGNIAMQYALDHHERLRSLTLLAPGSPYGFGGTRGVNGVPNYPDFAGSGGGVISSAVSARYAAKDFSADSPFAPRSALRNGILKPTFRLPPEREDALVEQMLMMRIGDDYYPGDSVLSARWPYQAPGVYGANNALSPKYLNQSALGDLRGGPPILWMRGADDQIVSDTSLADPAYLGKLRMIPGWPGESVCPPQPMLAQTRAMLDRYRAGGGDYREVVFADCGHAPPLEKRDAFLEHTLRFLRGAGASGE
ncbi:MAG TPA: alpha/beta hydrolase [Ktedonobacterales bacterium]|nr:alpha/beta hydrolase [Ktedonobacterales bacterium]